MNGEKRIFPFYKGKYMGVEPIGFANLKSAQAYMKKISDEDIYNSCFGGKEEYMKQYGYFCGLKPYKDRMEPVYTDRHYLRDMEQERMNELFEEFRKICYNVSPYHIYSTKERDDMAIEFEKKYGLYHWIYVDDKEFKKAKTKFYKENVEYREGILEVNVRWNDGSITPAPERK